MTGNFERKDIGFPNTMRVWGRSLLLLTALSACSTVPDAVNPVEWYKGTRDFIAGKDEPAPAAKSSTAAKADGKPAPTAENRKTTPKGLVADRGNAQYAEPVRREVAPTRPLARRTQPAEQTQVAANNPAPAIQAAPLTAAGQNAAARANGGPDAPPAAMNMTPPPPADIPETVAVPGRPKRLQQQYEMRLAESAQQVVRPGMVEMPQASHVAYGRDDAPIHLVPPGSVKKAAKANVGGGKGFAAPLPTHEPSASFQVASVQFDNGSGLSRADKAAIGEVVRLYKQTKGVVRVVAFAPSPRLGGYQLIGGVDASQDRADAVARELNRRGIPAAKIMVAALPEYGQDGAQIFLDVM
ncbi:MAG: putative translation initiation factor [Rhodospirillaceae bacterium]|nr:MAG: putative translation initiation factor [Rhodospirillaceae bacterium]TNC93798.1 MAG: putative translation initiation factor IF-2 [Stygiobacter sp.]